MKLSCEVVGMIASFVCETIRGAMAKRSAGEVGSAVRSFMYSQLPTLVALHLVDKKEESVFLSACERLGKGLARVLLDEEEV